MLFCITANYTPKGMEAMGKSPNTNRQEAVQKLLTAAGAKLVAMYYTIADGPGAMVIFDADPGLAPAIAAVVASSDAVQNTKLQFKRHIRHPVNSPLWGGAQMPPQLSLRQTSRCPV